MLWVRTGDVHTCGTTRIADTQNAQAAGISSAGFSISTSLVPVAWVRLTESAMYSGGTSSTKLFE